MQKTIRFDATTLQKSSIWCPNAGDWKMMHWASGELQKDSQAHLGKLLRKSLETLFGRVPGKKRQDACLHRVECDGDLFLWVWSEGEKDTILSAFTACRIGTDPEAPRRVVCLWHYRCLVVEGLIFDETPASYFTPSRN